MVFIRLFLFLSSLSLPFISHAQNFTDTTDGSTEESDGGFTKEEFEKMKNSPDPGVRELYEKLVRGRLSSSKSDSSRFSGHLEFHDDDLDGVSDHGNSANTAEGGVEEALLGKRGLADDEKRSEALRKARISSGACIKNITRGGVPQPCGNLSGAMLDVGGAHAGAGDDEEHRVYDANPQVKKAMEKAGETYFEQFKADILKGKNGSDDIYANDAIRSEAAWLYQQWQHKMDTSWKTLRAARLVGYRTDKPEDGDYAAAQDFMRRIAGVIARKGSNREIASQIALQDQVMGQEFCFERAANWRPKPTTPPAGFTCQHPTALRSLMKKPFTPPAEGVLAPTNPSELYQLAVQIADREARGSRTLQEKISKIERCMSSDVWCTTRDGYVDGSNRLGAFEPVKGDPGGVFWDTREPLYMKMALASRMPLSRQRAFVEDLDFSARMAGGKTNPIYKEWDTYMKRIEAQVEEMREFGRSNRLALEKAGRKGSTLIEDTFDPKTKTVLQMFGRNAVNDSWSLPGSDTLKSPTPASTGGNPPNFKNPIDRR